MRNFQQKRGFRNIIHSRPVLVLLGILVLIFAWGIVGFVKKAQVTRENRKISENEVAELVKEKVKLSSDIAKLKTDNGLEESIREKFGLAKEGEGLIVVVEDKNPPPSPQKDSGGFFSFFTKWFR